MKVTFTASYVLDEWAQEHEYGCTIDSKPATKQNIVELFTTIAMADQTFAGIIADTFDNILAADVEMDELLKGE